MAILQPPKNPLTQTNRLHHHLCLLQTLSFFLFKIGLFIYNSLFFNLFKLSFNTLIIWLNFGKKKQTRIRLVCTKLVFVAGWTFHFTSGPWFDHLALLSFGSLLPPHSLNSQTHKKWPFNYSSQNLTFSDSSVSSVKFRTLYYFMIVQYYLTRLVVITLLVWHFCCCLVQFLFVQFGSVQFKLGSFRGCMVWYGLMNNLEQVQ